MPKRVPAGPRGSGPAGGAAGGLAFRVDQSSGSRSGQAGPWSPAQRWWQGNQPEWDVVASSVEGDRLLLGEVKWRDAALSAQQTGALAQTLVARQAPPLANDSRWRQVLRVLFVPLIRGKPSLPPGVAVC